MKRFLSVTIALAMSGCCGSSAKTKAQDTELESLVADCTTDIERIAGRQLTPPPSVRFGTADEVFESLCAEASTQLSSLSANEEQRVREMLYSVSRSAFGKYVPSCHSILIVPGRFNQESRLKRDELLRVVLLHELAHASDNLSDRVFHHLSERKRAEEYLVYMALVEGHAQWMTRKALSDRGNAETFEVWEDIIADAGTDISGAQQWDLVRERTRFAYIDGHSFFNQLVELGREDLMACVFTNPPADTGEILNARKYVERSSSHESVDWSGLWAEIVKSVPGEYTADERTLGAIDLRTSFGNAVDAGGVLDGLQSGARLQLISKESTSATMLFVVWEFSEEKIAQHCTDLLLEVQRKQDTALKKYINTSEYGTFQCKSGQVVQDVHKVILLQGDESEFRAMMVTFGRYAVEILLVNKKVTDEQCKDCLESILRHTIAAESRRRDR